MREGGEAGKCLSLRHACRESGWESPLSPAYQEDLNYQAAGQDASGSGLPRTAMTNHQTLEGLNNRHLFLNPGGGQSKVTVLADLV